MRFDNVFVSKWTQIRYHNTIDALKKKKRRGEFCPGVFSLVVIVVTVLILDKWTQYSIPILERNFIILDLDSFFPRSALRSLLFVGPG